MANPHPTEPRGQTDLEFLVEKILNRSDPKDKDTVDAQEGRTIDVLARNMTLARRPS